MNTTDTYSPPTALNDDVPVVLIKQSHDLALDPDALGSNPAVAVVPACLCFQAGDRLTLVWQGYYDGVPESEWSEDITLDGTQAGYPLVWKIPEIEVLILTGGGGHAEIGYTRTAAGESEAQPSPVQIIQIRTSEAQRLEAPVVVGHDAGQPIDSGEFPEGITLQLKAWVEMQVGDQVVMYWDGYTPHGSFIDSLRIEADHVLKQTVEFHLAPVWLSDNEGHPVTVLWQYARPGISQSSEPLVLTIIKPVELTAPIVEKATAEGESHAHQGVLQAQHATTGVYVRIPETVPIQAQTLIEMHWQGHPAGGQYIAREPASVGDDRRFYIPATAVAANMGANENKRFAVFYRLIAASGRHRDSTPFNLRILPLSMARYPIAQWSRLAGAATLSLASVAASGEVLHLEAWPFMASGQLVTLRVAGVSTAGAAVSTSVRDAVPVTPQEVAAGKVVGTLARSFLQALKLDEYITLTSQVSFDGGETQTHFYSNQGVRLVR